MLEQVRMRIKGYLRGLFCPSVSALADRVRKEKVVTKCIHEYYEPLFRLVHLLEVYVCPRLLL